MSVRTMSEAEAEKGLDLLTLAGQSSLADRLWARLASVVDPEIPAVSILEMGMLHRVEVRDGGHVAIEVLPTFSGCPALDVIARDIEACLRQDDAVADVVVTFIYDPPWSTDRITLEGRHKLKDFGIAPAPPVRGRPLAMWGASPVVCPFCGSTRTVRDSLFGPTPCRSVYHCEECRNPFERFKAL